MEIFRQFLYPRIPHEILLISLVVFLCGILFLLWKRKTFKWYYSWTLMGYLLVLYSSLVLFRAPTEYSFDVYPFWHYIAAYKEGKTFLLAESVLNAALFIPIGMLTALIWDEWKLMHALLIGCLISTSIEILQYSFDKGVAEFDDVFHNMMGCIVGFFCIRIAKTMINRTRFQNR